ncbi:MAG: molybdopterin molybdotransferase MoeA [Clostridia bacterium]|nr:molybdopterin molybdotransferase MoeA [Clostridia bacterium]
MLNVVNKEQAVRIVNEQGALSLPIQKVSLADALGRTLAEDIVSCENIPAFERTTVDGFAVHAADTFGASESVPAQLEIVGEILMGENADFVLKSGQCARISTGGMLPQGADAAVMVERTDSQGSLCLVYQAAAPFENVTRTGDDIACGACALSKGTVLTAASIGVLAALGVREVPVFRKPVLAIISTGDEIVEGTPQPGQMRDVNTHLLAAAAQAHGCQVQCCGVIRDERSAIQSALSAALETADAVLISGGSSAGARDMTVSVIEEAGEVFFHGIAMKPGKPTIFGMAGGKPVFGLPGHPLAAYFVFRLVVCAWLASVLRQPADVPCRSAAAAVNIPSNHGREEYLCVKYTPNGEIVPVHTKSGIVSVLTEAQGFLKIERNAEGVFKGETVEIYEI